MGCSLWLNQALAGQCHSIWVLQVLGWRWLCVVACRVRPAGTRGGG